jgi:hypothetical protein
LENFVRTRLTASKKAKHAHHPSPYPTEITIRHEQSVVMGIENEVTPISTKERISHPRKKLADIGNFQNSRDESQYSLLKVSSKPKMLTLDSLQSGDESEDDEVVLPKWSKNFKKCLMHQSLANDDLCATLFKSKPAVVFSRIFKK